MKIRTATMDDLNEIANVEADLTDEMYEKAAMHNEDGAWQMIFGVKMLMYGREAQSKTRIASPATIPKSGERNRKIHSCMLYLISI